MGRLVPLLLLCACASAPVRLYEGAPRPAAEVVRVVPDEVLVYSVDDWVLSDDARVERRTLELLPGEHVVTVVWTLDTASSSALPIYPRGRAYHSGVATRSDLMTKYRKYFREVRIEGAPGTTYRGVWLDLPENPGPDRIRTPDLVAVGDE